VKTWTLAGFPIVLLQVSFHLCVLLFIRINEGSNVVIGLLDNPFQMFHGATPATQFGHNSTF